MSNSTKDSTEDSTYKKLSILEHVEKLPSLYIGSIEPTNEEIYIYDTNKIILKN